MMSWSAGQLWLKASSWYWLRRYRHRWLSSGLISNSAKYLPENTHIIIIIVGDRLSHVSKFGRQRTGWKCFVRRRVKTKIMIVSRSRTVDAQQPPLIIIGQTVLKESDNLNRLVVTFDSKMSFEKHLRRWLGILGNPCE